jgi:RNA polymerase sigma-70 factor (ECF subfamily)
MASEVTRLLGEWRDSRDERVLDRLIPLVYDELRSLAARRLGNERPGHTLQPTALVNEAYIRLVEGEPDIENRAHFFALAARTMRRVLIEHARARKRDKRGGGVPSITLTEAAWASDPATFDLVALDEALTRLAEIDPRKTRVVELHFFGGLTYQETSMALGISEATVDRDLRVAKAWLAEQLT